MSMIETNNRVLGGKDKVFAVSGRAKEATAKYGTAAVSNATIGAIQDDDGHLVVLSSVAEALQSLTPAQFSEYAPIAGLPAFLEAAKKSCFGDYLPDAEIRGAVSPGGTGALRNAISNYTCPGDVIVTADWNWGPYKNLSVELGRTLETYELFDENGAFNIKAFTAKMNDVLSRQPRFFCVFNTPAHNPTGYCITKEDWTAILSVIKKAAENPDRKILIVLDTAYIDFCKDPVKERAFFKYFEHLPENILPLVAYSMSKSFTVYGMRGGCLFCLAPSKAIAEEFASALAFSCRATWSNCNRSVQEILIKIYDDPALLAKVESEREELRAMLLRRGDAFVKAAKEVNLRMTPFSAGFFCVVPCENPDDVEAELEKDNVFCLALAKGLRVSIASVSEAKCALLPAKIKAAIEKENG